VDSGPRAGAQQPGTQRRIADFRPLARRPPCFERNARIHVDRERIDRQVQATVAAWRGLLTGSVENGRAALRYLFEAPITTGEMISAAVFPEGGEPPEFVASPPGHLNLYQLDLLGKTRRAA
jgi:hypothetical protein